MATCTTRDLLPQAQNNDLAGETEHSLWVDNGAYYTTQSSLPEFWLGRIRKRLSMSWATELRNFLGIDRRDVMWPLLCHLTGKGRRVSMSEDKNEWWSLTSALAVWAPRHIYASTFNWTYCETRSILSRQSRSLKKYTAFLTYGAVGTWVIYKRRCQNAAIIIINKIW